MPTEIEMEMAKRSAIHSRVATGVWGAEQWT